jgi:chloride channel protein, CIC family
MQRFKYISDFLQLMMKSNHINNRIIDKVKTFRNNSHFWRLKYISNRTFLVIACIIVGVISALAAVVLKMGVHYLQYLTSIVATYQSIKFVYIVIPLCGIVITYLLIKYVYKGTFEKGLGSIIYDISWNSAKIKPSKTYSHIFTSGITVGLGGSAGLEAPIAITGSAIGSNIARLFKLGYNERVILLACGAASGIAAVFNSPIAGVVFAIEILLTNFSIPIFIPLLISAASATIVSTLLYKGQLFYLVTDKWYFDALPFYVVLGIITGLFSVYITRVTLFMEGRLNKKNSLLKPIIGGLVLGGLIFIFPPLWGEGYKTIEDLLKTSYSSILENSFFEGFAGNDYAILIFAAAIILLKSFATAITTGSGGNGGIFAPSLFTGALMGFSLAFFINITGIAHLSISNFVAVGMAGILSGVVRAPLTAIFLIAEVTGGYVLFVPLMLVSALSFFIVRYFEPYSIYTKRLAQKGQLMTDDKDMNTLSLLKMQDIIKKDFATLKPDDMLAALVQVFQESSRNLFPVVDENDIFHGTVHLEKIKSFLFKPELYSTMKIAEIMDKETDTVNLNDNMMFVMDKFEMTRTWNIVVVDGNKYVGIISKSDLIEHYRRMIKKTANLF